MDTQKRAEQPRETEEQKRQPLWRQVRPSQVLLTGGSLLATGAADAALHLDATGVFLGILATFIIARHSNDILEYLVPGSDAAGVVAATEQVVNAAAPQMSEEDKQAVGAKLRRLFFLKSRMPAPPSETAGDDAEATEEIDTILIPEEEALAVADRYAMEPLKPKAVQPNVPQQTTVPQQPRKPGRRVPAIFGEDPRRRLLLADNFQPDANPIAKTGGLFVGVQGSGKTTAMVKTCEQYIKGWKLGGFYFDIKGIDFKSLVTSGFAPRGLIVTQDTLDELDERYAEHGGLVRTALHNQWQGVFDLPTWREPGRTAMSRRLISEIMTRVINDLMAEAAAIPPGSGRLPFIVAIDEVQRLAPQNKHGDPELLDALVGLSTTGRAAALTPFFACPRIAEVDKDLIGSVELRVFGQATLLQDVQIYQRYAGADTFSDEEIRGLGTGEMIVCLGGQCVLAQFYDRETPHGSHNANVDDALAAWERGRPPTMPAFDLAQTPGMEVLPHHKAPAPSRSYAQRAGQVLPRSKPPAPAPSPYYQPAYPYQPPAPQAGRSALPEQVAFWQPRSDALPYQPAVAPSEPRAFAAYAPAPYVQPTQPVASAQAPVNWQEAEKSQAQHFTKAVGPELQAAYDAYRPGMNHHMLARALGTTPVVAGHLLKQLQMRGLIDAAGNKTVASPQVSQEDLREYDRAVAIWHDLEEKKRANVRDFAAAMKMGETKAWDLLRELDRLGLIHWERRKKKDVV